MPETYLGNSIVDGPRELMLNYSSYNLVQRRHHYVLDLLVYCLGQKSLSDLGQSL